MRSKHDRRATTGINIETHCGKKVFIEMKCRIVTVGGWEVSKSNSIVHHLHLGSLFKIDFLRKPFFQVLSVRIFIDRDLSVSFGSYYLQE